MEILSFIDPKSSGLLTVRILIFKIIMYVLGIEKNHQSA